MEERDLGTLNPGCCLCTSFAIRISQGVCALVLLLMGCVALGKLLNFSVPDILYPKTKLITKLHYRFCGALMSLKH